MRDHVRKLHGRETLPVPRLTSLPPINGGDPPSPRHPLDCSTRERLLKCVNDRLAAPHRHSTCSRCTVPVYSWDPSDRDDLICSHFCVTWPASRWIRPGRTHDSSLCRYLVARCVLDVPAGAPESPCSIHTFFRLFLCKAGHVPRAPLCSNPLELKSTYESLDTGYKYFV